MLSTIRHLPIWAKLAKHFFSATVESNMCDGREKLYLYIRQKFFYYVA